MNNMELSGQDIREYVQKRIKEKHPQNEEEVIKILEEVFHELKVTGRVRKDVDLNYWKSYFSQRWKQFLERK